MTDRNQETEDKLLQPYQETIQEIFQEIRDETFPERIEKLPENIKKEVVASLASIEIIREALGFIIRNDKMPEEYKKEKFHLKFPFTNNLLSNLESSRAEKETIKKIKEWSLEQLPQIIKNLKDPNYIAQAYKEFGIKGEVDISFENREQQNAAYMFTNTIREIIYIHTLQESLKILGENALEMSEEGLKRQFYEEILSFEDDISGTRYIKTIHLPKLKEAYLNALARESSPKEPATTNEERIQKLLEETMSPAKYKDWQVASVITKEYERLIENFLKEVL